MLWVEQLGGANNAYASDPMFTTPLAFNGTGYLASRGTISDFPSVDVSISMWVRTTDVSRPGTLKSFTGAKLLSGWTRITNLRL